MNEIQDLRYRIGNGFVITTGIPEYHRRSVVHESFQNVLANFGARAAGSRDITRHIRFMRPILSSRP